LHAQQQLGIVQQLKPGFLRLPARIGCLRLQMSEQISDRKASVS
jgi:hypothetical protein